MKEIMMSFKCIVPALLLLMVQQSVAQRSVYLDEIKHLSAAGLEQNDRVIARWKATTTPNALWGYDAPAHPAYLAGTLAFLYKQTGERRWAEEAARLLASYSDFRKILPKGYEKTRAEYAEGVPAISNFFFIAPYIRAFLEIKDSGVMDKASKATIEKDIAGSADYLFHFPEWGPHNRAILRAEALLYAYHAIPDHPHAHRWKEMSDILANDSMKEWEIEDATGYHGVWLLSLFSYAEEAGRLKELFDSPLMRYSMTYYCRLIGPQGCIPEFGDSRWDSGWESLRFVAIFEQAASFYHDPELKWAATRVFASAKAAKPAFGVGDAYALTLAYRWADDSLLPKVPTGGSQAVMDDIVGKKIVFRSGWDKNSTYMLLNYRDEGEGGSLFRDYLRQTISVEEEKMTHGHADENNIGLLMSKGSVLLTDADYRPDVPSGPFGAWRADYFHNRLVVRLNKRDSHQSVLDFVRNSGAYRHVTTQKIDFLTLRDADMSRTRVTDEKLGYQWDRIITYFKQNDWFVVIDGIKVLRPDYFTFTNFWHGQSVLAKGEGYFDIATDSARSYHFPKDLSLLVYFPESYAKTTGDEPMSRNYGTEHALYQSISSSYKAGDMEVFVTVLVPHKRGAALDGLMKSVTLLPLRQDEKAVGLSVVDGGKTYVLGVKLDPDMDVARANIRPRYLYDLGKVTYGDVETDAQYLLATIDRDSLHYSASNMLKVLYKGKPLMQALPNTHGLQLDGTTERIGFTKWRYWEETVSTR
jgi:hypothetical protein